MAQKCSLESVWPSTAFLGQRFTSVDACAGPRTFTVLISWLLIELLTVSAERFPGFRTGIDNVDLCTGLQLVLTVDDDTFTCL